MIFKYIAGNKLKHAIHKASFIKQNNKIPIINFSVENNLSNKIIFEEFKKISKYVNNEHKVALKLSLFNFNLDIIKKVIDLLIKKNVKVLIDAENENNFTKYNNLSNQLIKIYNKDKANILKTYQMYRKDSMDILEYDCNYAKNNCLYQGIKLVRGAYYKEDQHKNVLFNKKEKTDLNYNKSLIYLYNNSNNKSIIIASHNQESINLGYLLNQENKIFEFAHLLGMNEKKYDKLIKNGEKVNVYIPYGPYQYMLPYLTRRLYENIDTFKYM